MTDPAAVHCLAPTEATPFRWRCPRCGGAVRVSADEARCGTQGHAFARTAGIWRFLSEPGLRHFAVFERQYTQVRCAEGWGKPEHQYYRRLPEVAADDPQAPIWRQRVGSFRALLQRVVLPLEAERRRPLTILDLGAGNCWLAYRLAGRGHNVAAVDVRTDELDGLGAQRWYSARSDARPAFTAVQAAFDRLPFADDQADLVIFNASLHYSTDVACTLGETVRVLRPDGRVAVLDSPVYRDRAAGAAMVREREARFEREYGFRSNKISSEHYLTYGRLQALAATLGLRWRVIALPSAWRCLLRGCKARVQGQREPGSFPLVVGEPVPSSPQPHSRPIRAGWRLFRQWRYRLFQRHRYDRLVLEQVAGLPLLVLPAVFNPKLLHSGEFLARSLTEGLVPSGGSVLDLGTGTGIGALVAARWAGRVVAVDINPAAVRCARVNALLQQREGRVEVREGDLFAPVADERFDLVLFNPPYYRGAPRDALDRAWRSPDVVERFAAELAGHLTPGGSALLVLSTVGETPAFLAAFRRHDLAVTGEATRDLGNESLLLLRLRPRGKDCPC